MIKTWWNVQDRVLIYCENEPSGGVQKIAGRAMAHVLAHVGPSRRALLPFDYGPVYIHEQFPRMSDGDYKDGEGLNSQDVNDGDPTYKMRPLVERVIKQIPKDVTAFYEQLMPGGLNICIGVLHVDTNVYFRLMRAYDIRGNMFVMGMTMRIK